MRILLADDHGLMLTGARLTLEADGFEIVGEAQSGPQVLPLVARTNPEVVLLDLRMPGIDGLECLSRIRDRHPEVKVVMCSMSNDADQIQGAFRRGACGYILKTIDPIDLGSAIRQAVYGTAFHAPSTGLVTLEIDGLIQRYVQTTATREVDGRELLVYNYDGEVRPEQ